MGMQTTTNNKQQGTENREQTTNKTTGETSDNEQPHGHLKRLISCLNAHKSHQIHWKQHLALRLRFVVIVTGKQKQEEAGGGGTRTVNRWGRGDALGLLTFLLPSSDAHPAVINKSGNGDDAHCVLARPGASRRQSQRRCLPSGKRQTNDSWLDKHLDGGSAKRASNGKLWNYAIRFRTHLVAVGRPSARPPVPCRPSYRVKRVKWSSFGPGRS